ncbi:MAG: cytochrome c [Kiloniellales bacterium]
MKKAILAAAALVVGFAGQALAVNEPQNVIKYRQAVMKAIGGHTGAIVGVVKGEVSYVDHVPAHARAIGDLSKQIGGLFPEGTSQFEFPNTRALPELWDDKAKFDAAVKALQAEAAKMVEVAGSGDLGAIGAQLQNLGKACGGCHKPFRAKKQ